jgi:hypothetical protein
MNRLMTHDRRIVGRLSHKNHRGESSGFRSVALACIADLIAITAPDDFTPRGACIFCHPPGHVVGKERQRRRIGNRIGQRPVADVPMQPLAVLLPDKN